MGKNMCKYFYCILALVCMIFLSCSPTAYATEAEEVAGNEIVSCSNGFLRIDAKDIRPEDLIKEIGEKCGIKIVVFGEAFTDTPVSMKFQKMPLRKGIERVLRVINVPNFLLHFDNTDNDSRIAELDLIGKKGGEKHLTAGSRIAATTTTTVTGRNEPPKQDAQQPPDRREQKKEAKTELSKEDTGKMQENFLKIMDEVLKNQEGGDEPDPGEILKLFKEAVPPEMKDQIPPEVMEELERLEAATPPKK